LAKCWQNVRKMSAKHYVTSYAIYIFSAAAVKY
jgi:hypothetical protein